MQQFKRLLTISIITTLMLFVIFALTNSASAKRTAKSTAAGVSPAHNPGAFLSGPNEGRPVDIALNYISQNRQALGLSQSDIADMAVSDQYTSQHNGVTHIYFRQTFSGIGVYNGLININIAADGSVINLGNRFVPYLSTVANGPAHLLSAEQAVQTAAGHLGLIIGEPLVVEEIIGGPEEAVVLSDGGISLESIPVKLIYQPLKETSARLAWDLSIYELNAQNWWSVRIDANNGQLLSLENWVDHDYWGPAEGAAVQGTAQSGNLVELSASMVPTGYLAYPIPVESPNFGVPAPPGDARVDHVAPWFDAPNASPYGWQDLDGDFDPDNVHTNGNNVDAYEDSDNSNGPTNGNKSRVNGGPTLDFSTPLDLTMDPTQSISASIVNLYYWNNLVHDVMYEYGFDEAGGNFQFMNYTGNGLGGDSVQAEAQDGGGNCNANFGTPPDGSRPRMQQYLCNLATPRRDSSLDNGVIAHEYGHGISNRLTGGPSNTGCLGNAEQMGEGWSDWVAYMMTIEPGDVGSDERHIGTWLFGTGPTGPGIRLFPYSTDFADNPQTYDSIITNGTSPHSLGEVWALMLWEVLWNLIDDHGFNPDIYDAWNTGGNNLMFQLVTDGMKLQPCAPGMVDGRDAILAADTALTGGANQCAIWAGFAKRGLGWSADQGSSGSRTDGTEAFDLPGFCSFVQGLPDTQDICTGTDAIYTVDVGVSWTSPPVVLDAGGHPAGTTAAFSPNPVNTVPGQSTLTIGSTAGAAPGSYGITITATDAVSTATNLVTLNVFDMAPDAPVLTTPADTAIDIDILPTFAWNASAQGTSYLLEVDDDPAFGSIDYTANVTGTTSHVATMPFNYGTTYYWRVQSTNVCGIGAWSTVFSFTTVNQPGSCGSGLAANIWLLDDLESGAPGWTHSGVQDTWMLSGARTTSGSNAWFAVDPQTLSDQRLVAPAITLPAIGESPLTLQFQNYQAFETPNTDGRCWDAGILEISADGGATWSYVDGTHMLTDPYDNVIWNNQPGNNPITNDYGAVNAWCDPGQPFTLSVVDLDDYAGQTVNFAWRLGSDSAAGGEGWYIDDVRIQSCAPPTSVSLSAFGEDGASMTPLWLTLALVAFFGAGVIIRRRYLTG